MTTEVEARDALAAAVQEAWLGSEYSDVPVFVEGGPMPQYDEVDRVLYFEIVQHSTEQVTIGGRPVDRTWGSLDLHFGMRDGRGTRELGLMRQYMKDFFKAKSFGSKGKWVFALIPEPRREPTLAGWKFKTLSVPFYFDSQ